MGIEGSVDVMGGELGWKDVGFLNVFGWEGEIRKWLEW